MPVSCCITVMKLRSSHQVLMHIQRIGLGLPIDKPVLYHELSCRYANLPLPISSVGVGAALGLESQYNTLRSQRHSFTYSPHIFARNNSENNR